VSISYFCCATSLVTYREHSQNRLRLDGHIEKVNEYMEKMNAQLIRYDEHMNRLDDIIWKSYFQEVEQKISTTQKVKTILEKR